MFTHQISGEVETSHSHGLNANKTNRKTDK